MTKNFYKNLKSFSDSESMTDLNNYQSLPSDWCIIITDVKSSTKAIEKGHYKNVNVAGVTSIIAVENACPDVQIPAVFGGDGATIFIPMSHIPSAEKALAYCQKKAKDEFDLDLRVSLIPMEEILRQGKSIFLAKIKLASEAYVTMARGDGLALAEELTKKSNQFNLGENVIPNGSHEGLECRWNPIQSKNGEMLSLLIKTTGDDSNFVYKSILAEIQKITMSAPLIEPQKLSLGFLPKHLFKEIQARKNKRLQLITYFLVSLKVFLLTLIVRSQINKKGSLVSNYLTELSGSTDSLKFEDILKTIVDASIKQKEHLLGYLDNLEKNKKIIYGVFSSKNALMTCFMRTEKNHIHYVDGGDGGYAMAAKMLKQKIQTNRI